MTGGKYRIGSSEEAQEFNQLCMKEGLLIEFVNALGRTIEVTTADGPMTVQVRLLSICIIHTRPSHHRPIKPAQAFPKGGWLARIEAYMDEHDQRILRAIAGFASPTDWLADDRSFDKLREAITLGRISQSLYDAFHSVCASTFARMAAEACGPNGRARTEPLRPKQREVYARNEVRIPRHVVAVCAARAIAATTTWRMANLEHARVAAGQPL